VRDSSQPGDRPQGQLELQPAEQDQGDEEDHAADDQNVVDIGRPG
jgi:hypothetical protein